MISVPEFEHLSAGQFVTLTLAGGLTLEGYAAKDPANLKVLRVDGFALEDDGLVGQFSLRLERSQIEAANILSEPPAVTDSRGAIHRMQPAFWD